MTQENHAPQPKAWIGLDVAKTTFEAALWGSQPLPEMRNRTFDRTASGAKALLAWLRAQCPKGAEPALVMEATGVFAHELAVWLSHLDPTLHVAIVNPAQTSAFQRSLGMRNKTDGQDARMLARYGHEREPQAWEPPTPEMARLRDLLRTRGNLVATRTSLGLSLADHVHPSKEAATAHKRVLASLDRQIVRLEKTTQALIASDAVLEPLVARCTTIIGVGLLTAATVLAELGDLRRFKRSRQLSAFAGLNPSQKQSGTSVRGRTKLSKAGSARARAVLFMAAKSAVLHDPAMTELFNRLKARGKHSGSAYGAVMRKVLLLMRAVLISGKDYTPRALQQA